MLDNGADPIYSDPAYPQSRHLFGGFRNPIAVSAQAQWNTIMSKVRECVEWGFGLGCRREVMGETTHSRMPRHGFSTKASAGHFRV
jgi:hypothetical protein